MKEWVEEIAHRYVARFAPADVERQSSAERRTGAMLVMAAPLLSAFMGPFILLYLWCGIYLSAAVMVALTGHLFAAAFAYRSHGCTRQTSRRMVVGLLVAGGLITLETGGLQSPALLWMTGFPLLSVLLDRPGEGLRTMVPLAATAVLLGAAHGVGLVTTESSLPAWLDLLGRAVSLPGAAGMLMLIAWTFDNASERMQSQLHNQRTEVERERERAVAAHRDTRLVLDCVKQPLILVDLDGRVSGEFSAAAAKVLPELAEGRTIWGVLNPIAPEVATWFRLVWPSLRDPIAPPEIAIAQMPHRMTLNRRVYDLESFPIVADDELRGMALGLVDVSASIEAEESQKAQKELQRLTVRVVRDAGEVRSFMEEARAIIGVLQEGGLTRDEALRRAHTLKGNAALMGLSQLADVCGEYESVLGRREPTADDFAPLSAAWNQIETRIRTLLVHAAPDIDLSTDELDQMIAWIRGGLPTSRIVATLESWKLEPASRRLERLADQAKQLALKLGKGAIRIELEHGDVRTGPELGPVWANLAHLVRNAVDHGLEPLAERVRAKKNRRGLIRIEAQMSADGSTHITVSDDGRGVDFDKLRTKAAARKLPVETMSPADLLFAQGLSTRDAVCETSGRGVGTSSVKEAVEAVGGRVEVQSAVGEGTTIELFIPPRPEMEYSDDLDATVEEATR